MSKRLDIINELKKLEERKELLEGILKDMGNRFFANLSIELELDTNDYHQQSNGKSLIVESHLFKSYIEEELEWTTKRIDNLIKDLSNEM